MPPWSDAQATAFPPPSVRTWHEATAGASTLGLEWAWPHRAMAKKSQRLPHTGMALIPFQLGPLSHQLCVSHIRWQFPPHARLDASVSSRRPQYTHSRRLFQCIEHVLSCSLVTQAYTRRRR